ncbi:hypothetical protein E2542_SST16860 [Spatholobus suberectus]|nr:hypothetical protein E2542_SST16860 [Spatholobus suberectus]
MHTIWCLPLLIANSRRASVVSSLFRLPCHQTIRYRRRTAQHRESHTSTFRTTTAPRATKPSIRKTMQSSSRSSIVSPTRHHRSVFSTSPRTVKRHVDTISPPSHHDR